MRYMATILGATKKKQKKTWFYNGVIGFFRKGYLLLKDEPLESWTITILKKIPIHSYMSFILDFPTLKVQDFN